MERSDLYVGRNDYGERQTFDAAEGRHYSVWGTDVTHEVFLNGNETEVELLMKGLRVLRAHTVLSAELADQAVDTTDVDKLIAQIETAQPIKRKEFLATHEMPWLREKRTQ